MADRRRVRPGRLTAGEVLDHHLERIRRIDPDTMASPLLTAAPELGSLSFTWSELHGVCRNPWDPTRTPGGSSGGSAAAVAAGLVPLATGSDSAGSLRIPAAFCGLVGFKGTYGRIPRGPGPVGAANVRSYGILARSVRDVARAIDVTSGPDGWDPLALPRAGGFEDMITGGHPVGLCVLFSEGLDLAPCESEVAAVARDAATQLAADLGLRPVTSDVRLPDATSAFQTLLAVDLFGVFGSVLRRAPETMSEWLRQSCERAGALSVDDLVTAHQARDEVNAALAVLFEEVDVLFLPPTSTRPFSAEGPMPSNVGGEDVTPLQSVAHTLVFNLSGHPAVSVPAGQIDGLPIGLQIVTRRHSDALTLRLAAALERIRPWPKTAHRAPPVTRS